VLRESDRAPGLLLGDGALLPQSAEVGAHVVIHDGTEIGELARIQDGAVLGKSPVLASTSRAPRETPPPLVLGEGVTVGAGAVVAAGARIGDRAIVGDQAHVRERAVIGERSLVGRGSAVECDVMIGARVRIQTGCYVTAFSEIEDDVFLGPGVTTLNDNTAGRRPEGEPLRGPRLRRGCRIGGGAVVLPGLEVGEDAFVAAGAVVTRDVPPGVLVVGVPARAMAR
jgi:UDP-2-acetamido-3-amino-2,3-dideoxy-glucuronate N-acetyltransferase